MTEIKKRIRFGVRLTPQLVLAVLSVISVDAKGGFGGGGGSRGFGRGGSSYRGGSWAGVYSRPSSGSLYRTSYGGDQEGYGGVSGERNPGADRFVFGNSELIMSKMIRLITRK